MLKDIWEGPGHQDWELHTVSTTALVEWHLKSKLTPSVAMLSSQGISECMGHPQDKCSGLFRKSMSLKKKKVGENYSKLKEYKEK